MNSFKHLGEWFSTNSFSSFVHGVCIQWHCQLMVVAVNDCLIMAVSVNDIVSYW